MYPLLKKLVFLPCLLFGLLPAISVFGQQHTVYQDPTVTTQTTEIDGIVADPKGSNNLVTGYVFNDSLHRFLMQVSGTVLKAGQIQSISTVADDKSLTLNYALPFHAKWWSIQLTGTGASTKGFINVFTGNKFAKTLTFGGVINKFTSGHARYDEDQGTYFKFHLKDEDELLQPKLNDYYAKNVTTVAALIQFKDDHADFFSYKPTLNDYKVHFDLARDLHELLDKSQDFFPEALDTTDYKQVGDFIDDLKANQSTLLPYVACARRIKVLDSIQNLAPFGHYLFQWVSFTPKINQTDYPIYDPGNADKLFTRTESDYFASFALSYNWLWSYKKHKVFFYPGLTLQNSRIFKSSDSLSVNIQ